jgi:hypothetical protein
MYKVYLDLRKKIPAVFGNFISSDETYMYLQDGPVIRMVPLNKIAHIEDLSDIKRSPAPTTEKVAPQVPDHLTRVASEGKLEDERAKSTSPPLITDLADLRNKLKEKRKEEHDYSAVEPVNVSTMIVNVVVSGAEEKSIQVEVPVSSFVPNQYSPTLAKELAKNLEMKTLLETGVVFDGPPQVIGTNVYIKTKKITDTMTNMADKMGMMSKISSITSGFIKPNKNYVTDFSANSKTAIADSPFEQPILIDEDQDADSSFESTTGEEEDSGNLSDRNDTIHNEG